MPNIVANPTAHARGNTGTPGSVPAGSTNLDTETPNSGLLNVTYQLNITGTLAQLQADWTTLLATNLSSPSALLSFQ